MSAPRWDALRRAERRLTLLEEQVGELRSERRSLLRSVESLNRQVGELRSLLFQLTRRQPPDEEPA